MYFIKVYTTFFLIIQSWSQKRYKCVRSYKFCDLFYKYSEFSPNKFSYDCYLIQAVLVLRTMPGFRQILFPYLIFFPGYFQNIYGTLDMHILEALIKQWWSRSKEFNCSFYLTCLFLVLISSVFLDSLGLVVSTA